MKLGRLPTKKDPRTLKLSSYVKASDLPVPPSLWNWGDGVTDWGMMVNDQLGDCTCAAAGHMILMDTTLFKNPWRPTDADIVEMYHNVGGYVPGNPSTDNGAVEIDVLKYWRTTGVGGHTIKAFVSIDISNLALLRAAIWLFGGIYTGVDLPITAQDQDVWEVSKNGTKGPGSPGSWGGHAVPIVGYDENSMTCVTWGDFKKLTNYWWTSYGSEAYAIITSDWLPPNGVAPNNFNMDQLMVDLNTATKE